MHSQQNTSVRPTITLSPPMPIVLTHYDRLLQHPKLTPTTELIETISDLNTATHPEATTSGGSQQQLKNPLIEQIEAYFTEHTIPLGLLVALKHVFGKNLCIYLDDETTPDRWQHLQRTIKSLVELLSILPCKQISITRPSTQQKIMIEPSLSLQQMHDRIETLFSPALPRSGHTLTSALNAIHPPETLIYVFTHQSDTLATAVTQTKSIITMVDSAATTTDTRKPYYRINSLNQEQESIRSKHHGQIIYTQGIWFIRLLTSASQESPLRHINGQSPWGIGTLSQFYGYEFPEQAYQDYLQPFLQQHPDLQHFEDILTATFPRTSQTFIEASLESYRRFGTRPAASRPGKPPSPSSSLGLLAIPSTASLHAKTADHAAASNQPTPSNRPNSL